METMKAGCYLIDIKNKCVALVFRDKQNDFSFPKGHLEKGETLKECAIRETAEETKRVAIVLDEFEPYLERYITPNGEKYVCYMYIAVDGGVSNNTSEDTHKTYWIPIDKVEEKLTYSSLKEAWRCNREKIEKIVN